MADQEILGDAGDYSDGHKPSDVDVTRHSADNRILTRLERRRDWVIPVRSWDSAPETLQTFLENDNNEVRERISAARTLVMMSNSTTSAQSVEVRINQAIAISSAPDAPDDVNVETQPAFIESVNTSDMAETVEVLESLGLLPRYVEQVKGATQVPPQQNGNGRRNGNGKQ